MYEYHESHLHKLAKETLFKWLQNIEQGIPNNPEVNLPFHWRAPNFGIHMELPFYKNSDPYYFECSYHVFDNENEFYEPPGQLLFVPDITVFHKGAATILIEIIHKSPVTKIKLDRIKDFFEGYHLELYSITAENILNQTNKYCNLKFKPLTEDAERFFDKNPHIPKHFRG